jgi:hypothetical protein
MLGLILVIAAPSIGYGVRHSTRDPLATLAWFQQHRAPGDSAGYASALYHASHAQATEANRWHPTGYATLSVVGTCLGLAILVGGRRTTDQPTAGG